LLDLCHLTKVNIKLAWNCPTEIAIANIQQQKTYSAFACMPSALGIPQSTLHGMNMKKDNPVKFLPHLSTITPGSISKVNFESSNEIHDFYDSVHVVDKNASLFVKKLVL
jgi:hypothetical protein